MSRTTLFLIVITALIFSIPASAQEPQASGPTKPNPDLNEDYEVTGLDVFFFSFAWHWMSEQYSHTPLLENSSSYGERSDFNDNGVVDKEDGYIFTSAWKEARRVTETPRPTATSVPPTPTLTSTPEPPTPTPTPTITPTPTPRSGWVQLHPSLAPSSREYSVMVYNTFRNRIILFGGISAYGISLNDTWEWNGTRWNLVTDIGPSPRRYFSMTYDAARKKVILFGGRYEIIKENNYNLIFLGDTWEWDGEQWTQVATKGPPARDSHMMTYDSARNKVVLFGGSGDLGILNDTWEWDGKIWTQVTTEGPPARMDSAMAYDRVHKKVILFGGALDEDIFIGDTWEWNGEQWTQVATNGPGPRAYHVMAYDTTRKKVVLFGGISGEYPNIIDLYDTWEWDGKTWTQVATDGPPLWNYTMAYDINRKRMILFGIENFGEIFGETWEYIPKS